MKKAVFFSLSSIILISFLISQKFTYVGSAKCAACHRSEQRGQQHPLWEKTKHATSFDVLTSDQAATYAQIAGVTNPATSPLCLECHAPLFDKAPEFKTEGVTCEVCHGPGSEYRQLNIMKDRELAKINGLIIYANEAMIRKQCLTCHANAHGKAFNFQASWEKIKHPVPRK